MFLLKLTLIISQRFSKYCDDDKMVRERKRFSITDYFSYISIYKLSIPTSPQNAKWTRKNYCTWKSKRRAIKRDKGIKWMEIDK